MFIAIGVVITAFSFIEIINKTPNKNKLFHFLALLLTLMLCFRWGQGTDYHAYMKQFGGVRPTAYLFVNSLYHGEIGWHILLVIAKRIGMNFETLVALLSLVMMGCAVKTIDKYSPYRVTSLLILYPTFYMTYFYSALRQGLVLSLFLYFGLKCIIKKKWKWYFLLIFFLMLLHSSAALLFTVPIALYFMRRRKKVGLKLLMAFSLALFLGYSGILNRVAGKLGIVEYFNVSLSYRAILLRVLLFLAVYRMHCFIKEEKNELETVFYDLYVIGFIMFIVFSFSATLSQRLTMPLKAVEIVLIPLQICLVYERPRREASGTELTGVTLHILKMGSFRISIWAVLILMMLNVEIVKNVDSYLIQGNYYSWVTPFHYPYISIFNKEDIYHYISYFK